MFGKSQMNIHYLETLTLEVPFRYIISFFSRINFQCMPSLVYTVYCQKQPSEQRCSVKTGVLSERFRKFLRKTPMLESLCNKVSGLTPILKNISQRLLLHCTLAPLIVTYPFYFIFSTFFLIITATRCLVLVQIQKASKN